jgi:hypothetical protein
MGVLCPAVPYSDGKVANRNVGRSLTRPFRDARRFPSTRLLPVPRATRTTCNLWIFTLVQGPLSAARANPNERSVFFRYAAQMLKKKIEQKEASENRAYLDLQLEQKSLEAEAGRVAALADATKQVRFCRYRFCPTGELKYRGAVG